MIDAVGYPDEARDDAKKLAGADARRDAASATASRQAAGAAWSGMLRALAGSSHGGAPHVAVVTASGSIAMSSSPSLLGGSEGITEHELGKVLGKLTGDASVKAVVLRIDSPGGSALASDLLWKKLRKLAAEKPLVVSIGDMAASGGYYLACAGTKIVAEPTSIVGSIGVVGGKFALGRALDEIRRPRRDHRRRARSPEGGPRRLPVGVHRLGRPDAGARAHLDDARSTTSSSSASRRAAASRSPPSRPLRRAASSAGSRPRSGASSTPSAGSPTPSTWPWSSPCSRRTPRFEVVDEEAGLLEQFLGESDATASSAESPGAALMEASAKQAARSVLFPPEWSSALPGASAFVGSLAPLLAGERALAAMPYGLTIR